MLLIPDISTLSRIPWKDDTARVLCDVAYMPEKEGNLPKRFEGCPRSILRRMERSIGRAVRDMLPDSMKSKVHKYRAHFAPELEFILVDENYHLETIHLDQNLGNDNYFIAPSEKVDQALKDMTRYMVEMGMKREKYHTEVTTYQYEIGVGHGNVLAMADAAMTLKFIIEQVAQLHGLKASFMPKFRKGMNGNGMHTHQNLAAIVDGKEVNLFYDAKRKNCLSRLGESYISGLLKFAKEITAITNPTPLSYKRLVPGCEAPTRIAWDWNNRTALCRGHSKGTNKVRVELRSPDPTCNPYIAFSAMLAAGLQGIQENLQLGPADTRDLYNHNVGVEELPRNLGQALELMHRSSMLRRKLGVFVMDNLHMLGSELWKDYGQDVSDIDIRRFS
jgi:glutamine synthetase